MSEFNKLDYEYQGHKMAELNTLSLCPFPLTILANFFKVWMLAQNHITKEGK